MRVAVRIARIVVCLMFVVLGMNHLVPFLHEPPIPPSDAATYTSLLTSHHVMTFTSLLMVGAGLLLLVGHFIPLALTLLGPILVNILLFHCFFFHRSFGPAVLCTLLEIFLFIAYRRSFVSLFVSSPPIFSTP